MFREFKKFISRGNVVDLAVGIAIGAAFTTVVNSIVKGLITPLVGAIYGQREFSDAYFTINDTRFLYGDVINSIITFIIIAAAIFFLVVQPINKLSELSFRSKTTDEPTTRKCPYCLGVVPNEATKCMHCTSELKKPTKKPS